MKKQSEMSGSVDLGEMVMLAKPKHGGLRNYFQAIGSAQLFPIQERDQDNNEIDIEEVFDRAFPSISNKRKLEIIALSQESSSYAAAASDLQDATPSSILKSVSLFVFYLLFWF